MSKNKVTYGAGTPDDPWVLKTPPETSEYKAWRDESLKPPALVVQVGAVVALLDPVVAPAQHQHQARHDRHQPEARHQVGPSRNAPEERSHDRGDADQHVRIRQQLVDRA